MVQFIQSHNILQLSEMQFQSSLKAQQNHFDLKCMMMMNDIVEIQTSHITLKETTLGMVDSLGPKLQDLFWRNLWKSSSIQERRGLWLTVLELQAILDCQVLHLTQQVLEMIKSMVIIFQQAILPIVHGSCVMDKCVSDQGEGIITSYLVVVVLSCSSNLFLLFY